MNDAGYRRFPKLTEHQLTQLTEKAIEGVGALICLCKGEPKFRHSVLEETRLRVVRALIEMGRGYEERPEDILSKTFEADADEIIVVSDIRFSSLCEHHLMPFVGACHVGYLPGESGRVVGLSKIPRLVECFARRLQLQERLTREIAQALVDCLDVAGAGVVMRAEHSCTACRGVRKEGSSMVTSAMLGRFREDEGARFELLRLMEIR